MSDPWTIIQNAVFGYTGCDGNMADRTASAIENLLEQAGYDITPIDRQPAPPASGDAILAAHIAELRRDASGRRQVAAGMMNEDGERAQLAEAGKLDALATLLESLSRNGEVERLREALRDDPNWIEAGIPDAAIEAGIAAWDQANHDMENYVSGVTADWDEGMIVAAIFKAVGRAALQPEQRG